MARKKRKNDEHRYYVADFETTVYEGQTRTDVWASAIVEIGKEKVHVWNCIEDLLNFLFSRAEDSIVYFHNLKFDGQFIIDWLLHNGYEPALDYNFDGYAIGWVKPWEMEDKQFACLISEMGVYYSITVKNRVEIKFIDSLKLIPMSVAAMGKSFETKHRKTSIEYTGYRQPHGIITDEEKKYIANDVLVVKESLEYMFSQGHQKMTIGSCCMEEYKKLLDTDFDLNYEELYPALQGMTFEVNTERFDYDEFIRKSYRGGWTYCDDRTKGVEIGRGCTCDVNSLYPSMMSSASGNRYPVGSPIPYTGKLPQKYASDEYYYFQEFECEFSLKDGYLPFVQIKGDPRYRGNEMLKQSQGVIKLVFTKTDIELFFKHYNVKNYKPIKGVVFHTMIGIFDCYIDKYRKMKIENNDNKGLRTIAKLFLNNLYGKMGANSDSSFKYPYLKENGVVGYQTVHENNKECGYVACGSAITSYARAFTINAAQSNYDYFCYADTDSIHCRCTPDMIKDAPVHPTAFNCWSVESEWDKAIFARQKTYIERVVVKDGKSCDPEYDIKCAGMSKRCKELVNAAITGEPFECKNKEEQEFVDRGMKLTDFKSGLKVPSKLMPKRIAGGIVLVDTYFEMREGRMV